MDSLMMKLSYHLRQKTVFFFREEKETHLACGWIAMDQGHYRRALYDQPLGFRQWGLQKRLLPPRIKLRPWRALLGPRRGPICE